MARKRIININRFDGGMTDAIRDTSNPSRFALISHFDIYRDPNLMYVMPGFERVEGFGANPAGIKVFDLRAFNVSFDSRHIAAIGTRSDGTGSKFFEVNDAIGSTTWVADGALSNNNVAENEDPLTARPFVVCRNAWVFYPIARPGFFLEIARNGLSSYTRIASTPSVIHTTNRYPIETAFDQRTYCVNNNFSQVYELTDTTFNGVKPVGARPQDLASGDYTVGIAQVSFNPLTINNLIWDAASLLADQNVRVISSVPAAIGFLEGVWVLGHDTGLSETGTAAALGNGRATAIISIIQGESISKFWELQGFPAAFGTENNFFSIKGGYGNSVLMHLRMAKNVGKTEFYSGVLAVGRSGLGSPIAVSQLLDTSSLGVVETVFNSGRRFYFAHSLDGSVSRLQRFDTGAYNVPATIETLVYGAETPFLKELNGISIVTENLPAGASVRVDFRTDVDSVWTELSTSNVTGRQKHIFTRALGAPIGRFQEIQFRITCNGRIVIKNIKIDITETNDLAF